MLRVFRLDRKISHTQRRFYQTSSSPVDGDKLKILFCGSDLFSITHLEALLKFKESGSSNITSIDVVTKGDRRTGRGLKIIKSPAIKQVALNHGLPLHQIDSFTGWTPPDINLIVAVSFGLLIPSRIIGASRYGGLNVHPSLLPDLRGAAPVQWAILHQRSHTGVSVQTLHATKFDHGMVLDQSEKIEIPDPPVITRLLGQLAATGADMLVNAIRHRLYLPPHKPIFESKGDVLTAPKLKDEHRLVDFPSMPSTKIDRMTRVFPFGLHTFVKTADQKLRLILQIHNDTLANDESMNGVDQNVPIGVPYAVLPRGEDLLTGPSRDLRVKTVDGKYIVIRDLTVEGRRQAPAVQAAARAHLLKDGVDIGGNTLHEFKVPLTAT